MPRTPWTTDRYLSNALLDGIPLTTKPFPSHAHIAPISPQRSPPISMSFNNNANNANLHTPSPTNHGPKKPTFLEVILSVEEDQNVWANRWGYFKRSDRTVASSEGVQAETGFGTRSCSPFDERDHIYESADSMSPAPSHAAPVTETYHPRYSQGHQLTTNWPTQLYYPVMMDRVTNTVALGALDPIRGKHGCPNL